ncbi:hypothetical protein JI664_21875 [Rhodobacter sp. NTK016B]|uniref:hypothetical protein n=1 Tax=Rhodobacter sp. NTK016B TaxID=2759676 RepID=UPI001A8F2CB8|nr:hypothetical protein [Rhodobacter sp. NTK016B]MBN8294636.1 hypothetical protein [Rhodobacter sp. NTK016B]
MAFVKTTPGHACKVAEGFDARWAWSQANSIVKEARDPDGFTIAYYDEEGWFVHASLAGLDMREVAA